MEEDSIAGTPKRLMSCIVKGCPHYYGTDNENIRFFRRPESVEQRAKWAEIILGEKGIDIPLRYQMCYLHFNSDDIITYQNNRKIPLTKLKKGALPLPFHIKTEGSKDPLADVKLVDIDDIKRTAPINAFLVENDSQSSGKMCKNCVYYDLKLQKANFQIASLQAKVTELTKKLKERPLIKKIIDSDIEQDVEIINLDESEETVTINIELKPLDTNEQSNESNEFLLNESNIFNYTPKIEPIDVSEEIIPIELEEQDIEIIEIDRPIEDIIIEAKVFKPYKCGRCSASFEKAIHLSRHMKRFCKKIPNHKLKKIFICTVCKKESSTLEAHEKHMSIHKQRCEICNELYLDDHLCGNENSICCEYCDKSFTITMNLLKHLEEAHEHKKLHRCGKCPKFLPMICLKEFHMKQHKDEPKKQFTCEICSKSITSKYGLQAHMQLHTNEKSHLCDECGKSFSTVSHLVKHKKTIFHGKEPHIQCPSCPKKFVNLAGFKIHSEMHRDDKYVCEICKAELISSSGYRQHMKRHTRTEADRKYACKICPLKFYRTSELKYHQAAHSTRKRFDCQLCDQSYKYSGDLNKHMKIHLGDKIYGCTKCPMRFQYPMELTKHSFEHYREEN